MIREEKINLKSGRRFERLDLAGMEELIGGEGRFREEGVAGAMKFKTMISTTGGAIGGLGDAGLLLPAEGNSRGRADWNVDIVVEAEEVEAKRRGACGSTKGGEGSRRSRKIMGGARATKVEDVGTGGRGSDNNFHIGISSYEKWKEDLTMGLLEGGGGVEEEEEEEGRGY